MSAEQIGEAAVARHERERRVEVQPRDPVGVSTERVAWKQPCVSQTSTSSKPESNERQIRKFEAPQAP